MPKLAKGREHYLSADEIARATVELFDAGPEPFSMRRLGARLGVVPTSIYRYFPSDAQVIEAGIGAVFEEVIADFVVAVGDPRETPVDPVEFLVTGGMVLRRAFGRHFRIAPYIANLPATTSSLAAVMAVFGATFEQMGLTGEAAGDALGAYGNYVYGSIILSAARRLAAERTRPAGAGDQFSTTDLTPTGAPRTTKATVRALDRVIGPAELGSERELERFEAGLRMLIAGMCHPS